MPVPSLPHDDEYQQDRNLVEGLSFLKLDRFGFPADVVAAAHYCLRRGWCPTPIELESKRPKRAGWQNERLDAAGIDEAFTVADPVRNVVGDQLGLVLGQPSGGLVVVDLDQLDPEIQHHFKLPTGMVDGREGKPDSHEFYVVEGRCAKDQWASAKTSRVILELLGDGQQVVVPPSLHPTGVKREWSAFSQPAHTTRDALVQVSVRRAVAQELKNIWPDHGRHDLALPVAGGLLRAGWDREEVLWLLRFLCPTSEKRNELPDIVERTANLLANDGAVTGWTRVALLTGERASVEKIVNWLGLVDEDLDDPRPRVYLNTQEPFTQAKRAWSALVEVNDPPFLYQSGGKLARVNLVKVREKSAAGGEAKTQPLIQPVKYDALLGTLSERLCWIGYTRGTAKQPPKPFKTTPPEKALKTMLAAPSSEIPLPVLNRIVSSPIFGPDGVLQTEPGYHASTHSFYWTDEDLALPAIPAKPTQSDIEQAKSLILDELLGDFPFVVAEDGTSPSKAHALALGLLPFGREFVSDGNTPLHFIDAPAPGTGKDKLVQSLGRVWNGRRGVPEHSQTNDEEEWRKVLLALVISGADLFYIANVKGTVKSAVLEGAVTGVDRVGRILGQSEMAVGEGLFTWVMTGNNASLGRDLARRVCPIRLDAKMEKPFKRTGFRHVLPDWALENRPRLLWAFLSLWQAWLAEGRPDGKQTLGSFEAWAKVIGGVLDVAGVDGFLGNIDAFNDAAVDELGHWRELVMSWWEQFGSQPVKASELFQLADVIDGFELGDSKTSLSGRQTQFGKQLTGQRDNRYGDLFVRVVLDSRTGRNRYRLEHASGETREKAADVPGNPSEAGNPWDLSS